MGVLNFKMAASYFVNFSKEVIINLIKLLTHLDTSNHCDCNKICAMLSSGTEFKVPLVRNNTKIKNIHFAS